MHLPQNKTVFCLMALALLGGCSRGNARLAVSGTVTVDGQPLAMGVISFQPMENKSGGSGTAIQQGKYELPAQRGLAAGKYRVLIQGFRETGRKVKDSQTGQEISETVPLRFKNADALEAIVTPNGPNRFDFQLQTAP